jgi:hypothetical protein
VPGGELSGLTNAMIYGITAFAGFEGLRASRSAVMPGTSAR